MDGSTCLLFCFLDPLIEGGFEYRWSRASINGSFLGAEEFDGELWCLGPSMIMIERFDQAGAVHLGGRLLAMISSQKI